MRGVFRSGLGVLQLGIEQLSEVFRRAGWQPQVAGAQ